MVWADYVLPKEEILSLARQGKWDSAYAASQFRLKQNPQDIFSNLMLGKLTLDGNKSITYFLNSLDSPKNEEEKEESYYRVGQFYYTKGNYSKAISYFNKTLQSFPKGKWRKPAAYWLGVAYLIHGLTNKNYIDSAEVCFTQLLKSLTFKNYYYTMALEGLARVRITRNEMELASETISMAMESAPPEQHAHLHYLSYTIAQLTSDSTSVKYYANQLLTHYPGSLEAQHINVTSTRPNALNKTISQDNKPGFALQVGAFSSKKNAEQLIKQWKSQNINLFLVEKITEKGVIFVLHTKKFHTRKNAENFGNTFLKRKMISYYVVEKN